jgi:hypothetical protein
MYFHSVDLLCIFAVFLVLLMLPSVLFNDSLETTRHVSMITITLSKKELDKSAPG